MGRAIDQDNRLDKLEIQMKEIEEVVAELAMALKDTKQTKHIDLVEEKPKKKPKKKVEAETT